MSVKKNKRTKEDIDGDKGSKKRKKGVKKENGKKSPSKKVEKNIKRAVDSISGLISQGMKEQRENPPPLQIINTSPSNNPNLRPLSYEYHKEQGKRRMIVWVGVGITTLLVFVMWGLNASTFISDTRHSDKRSDERQILENAGGDLKALIEATANEGDLIFEEVPKTKKEETLNDYVNIDEVKATLAGILSNLNISATNTLEQNTTSTIKLSTTTLSE